MKIEEVKITEMAKPVKLCPKCGKSMAAHHYWYKGAWKCKGGGGSTSAPNQSILKDLTAKKEEPPVVAKPMQQNTAGTPSQSSASVPSGPQSSNSQMEKWLAEHNITNYKVDPATGGLIVDQEVQLDGLRMKALPVKFQEVKEDFVLSGGMLETLEGSPEVVGGDYLVNHNMIKNLKGCPRHINEACTLSGNPFDSLEGAPEYIGQSLWLDMCPNLTSLHNIHKHIKYVGEDISLTEKTIIKSNILGLLMIKGLKQVKLDATLIQVQGIINKHLQGDRDPIACQDELIDAGFEPFARF